MVGLYLPDGNVEEEWTTAVRLLIATERALSSGVNITCQKRDPTAIVTAMVIWRFCSFERSTFQHRVWFIHRNMTHWSHAPFEVLEIPRA